MSIDPETMEELLASESHEGSLRPLRRGEIVDGTVATITGDEATVDLGDRPAGVLRIGGEEPVQVGDTVTASVVQPEGPDGRVVLSLRRSRSRRRWQHLDELRERGEIVEADVVDANRGGVIVDVGMRGFVPLSQLGSVGAIDTSGAGIPERVRALVGKRLRLRVLEVDPQRERLILSEKAATQQLRRARKAEGTARLTVDDVLEGTIVSVTSYGLFVDVGVADGLVHRSEITWEKGVEPTALYQVGQAVRVVVVSVDRERQRISLSIKRLSGDPWATFTEGVEAGRTVEATITRVMPYGAFAKVSEGVEGLIHVSELASYRVGDPNEVVRVGDTLAVKIVGIDAEKRRLSLSARLAEPIIRT